MNDGTTREAGPAEVMRLLRSITDEETLQRAAGRPLRVSEATLLRLALHGGLKGHGITKPSDPAEPGTARSAAEAVLRSLRIGSATPEAPRQQGQDGQPPGERGDALRFLSRERPLAEREAQILLDYLMNERLARRANREALKTLGNSVVPQVVAVIGRAILEAEGGCAGPRASATVVGAGWGLSLQKPVLEQAEEGAVTSRRLAFHSLPSVSPYRDRYGYRYREGTHPTHCARMRSHGDA